MMEASTLLELAVELLFLVLAAVVGFLIGSKRDRQQKRSELVTDYLLRAYRDIEAIVDLPQSLDSNQRVERIERLERAMANIYLLGSPEQVLLATKFGDDLLNPDLTAGANPLLSSLRTDLRRRLGLEVLDEKPWTLRIPRA